MSAQDYVGIAMFQSTRPQGARHQADNNGIVSLPVSIHAPAGGATMGVQVPPSPFNVSIHAPAGGATSATLLNRVLVLFQSTRPQGARLSRAYGGGTGFLVSIHAPAGGATFNPTPTDKSTVVSIHAPAGGATSCACFSDVAPECFNPRARRGRDLRVQFNYTNQISFNPRARRGRDSVIAFIVALVVVSIHAPAGGATPCRIAASPGPVRVSIHAPAGGATRRVVCVFFGKKFQSTRPQGARQSSLPVRLPFPSVSIHAPAGGATKKR